MRYGNRKYHGASPLGMRYGNREYLVASPLGIILAECRYKLLKAVVLMCCMLLFKSNTNEMVLIYPIHLAISETMNSSSGRALLGILYN